MSLRRTVAMMVQARGKATVDDLMQDGLLQGFTRKQVMQALDNARTIGLVVCAGKPSRVGAGPVGSLPATYYPAGVEVVRVKRAEPKPIPKPVSCVWNLAGKTVDVPSGVGRQVHPLGGW